MGRGCGGSVGWRRRRRERERREGMESDRQQSRWNVRGDQRVKGEEGGGALRKINAVLICAYLAVCRGFIFFMWREKKNSVQQSKF